MLSYGARSPWGLTKSIRRPHDWLDGTPLLSHTGISERAEKPPYSARWILSSFCDITTATYRLLNLRLCAFARPNFSLDQPKRSLLRWKRTPYLYPPEACKLTVGREESLQFVYTIPAQATASSGCLRMTITVPMPGFLAREEKLCLLVSLLDLGTGPKN